ncbi:MAG: potassium channel family protein [Rhodospirillales bacterium]
MSGKDRKRGFEITALAAGLVLAVLYWNLDFSAENLKHPLYTARTAAFLTASFICAAYTCFAAVTKDVGGFIRIGGPALQCLFLICGYAGIYNGELFDAQLNAYTDWTAAVYFSVVTWTTLGYGDFAPPPHLRLASAAQAMQGFLFFGVVVSLFAGLARRRDALRDKNPPPG